MKGGSKGVGWLWAVICVLPVRPPSIDTYTCGLYVKSLLHTRRTATISVEKRVAPGEKARNIFNFREKIFQCGGESPAAEGLVRSLRTTVSEKCSNLNWIYRFAFRNARPVLTLFIAGPRYESLQNEHAPMCSITLYLFIFDTNY